MNREEFLGTEKISKLMVRLAVPTIVAQFINILYNMVDRIYIGRIPGEGAMALTGLGVCFPLILVISAFSAFVGNGGAPLAAIQLGRGNREEAGRIMENGVFMLAVISAVLTVVFYIFQEPLLYLCGASENTIGYAKEYMSVYLLGTVFVQFALGLNQYISAQGQALTAMLSVLIGAVTNIILDPILIFGYFGFPVMGVRGAALATIISQAISAAWVVGFLCSKRSVLRINRGCLKPELKIIGRITSLGVSPFIMQSTEGLISLVFNTGLRNYGGDMYVGAMTILSSISQLLSTPVSGFTNGVQPIISYNYGARNIARVKAAIFRMFIVTASVSVAFCTAITIVPRLFVQLFATDEELISLTAGILPIFMLGRWIFSIQMTAQPSFVAMGNAKVSTFIAVFRKIILLIPLALILPRYLGVMGIYYAEPVSDALSATVAGVFLIKAIKTLNKMEKEPALK